MVAQSPHCTYLSGKTAAGDGAGWLQPEPLADACVLRFAPAAHHAGNKPTQEKGVFGASSLRCGCCSHGCSTESNTDSKQEVSPTLRGFNQAIRSLSCFQFVIDPLPAFIVRLAEGAPDADCREKTEGRFVVLQTSTYLPKLRQYSSS